MKKFILPLITALVVSCNTSPKQEEQPSKMKEVIAIHDEAMPKMGTLARLARELNEKIEAEGATAELENAVKDLGAAKTQMMEWMRDFGGKFSADQILKGAELTQEQHKLLDEELQEVIVVRDDILNSIARAESLLGKKD